MTVSLNAEVRARLDAHLDAVERALAAGGSSREQRRGVVDDLEAQILDMLAGRSEMPSNTDLEAVLATLDPPLAYGDARPSPASPAAPAVQRESPPLPRISSTAIAGLILTLIGVLPLLVFATLRIFVLPGAWRAADDMLFSSRDFNLFTSNLMSIITRCLVLSQLPMGLAGTLLSWVAFVQIRKSHGTLRGRALAIIGGTLYPIAMTVLLCFKA